MEDFYLVTAKSRQGLSSVIHFRIVYNDTDLESDNFHILMYKLCFLYFNTPGSIKVPAPCHYAMKLASLCAEKLSSEKITIIPDKNVFFEKSNNLFYL